MRRRKNPTISIILYHLEEPLAAELAAVIAQCGGHVASADSAAECMALAGRLHADVVFSDSDPRQYGKLLDGLRQNGNSLPVVVASRLPEVTGWLDALEAGAADFCSRPFEARQVRWVIESAMLSTVPLRA